MPRPERVEGADDALASQLSLERELTQRILHSETFRNSQMLQQLLLYLAQNAKGGESGALKEYSIGVDALGRKADFDPKIDPIVRVQMHRLRQKLKEYYAVDGAHDPLVLEVPMGQYQPIYRRPYLAVADAAMPVEPNRQLESLKVEEQPALPLPVKVKVDAEGRRRTTAIIAYVFGAFLCGLVAALFWMRVEASFTSSRNTLSPEQKFWSQFLGNDTSPIIGYPDAVFLLDESNDLFRFRRGATDQRGSRVTADVVQEFAANPALATKAGPLYYENGYTGTGELESVAMLSSLFATLHVKPTIKSSRDITMADLEQHNVILLGSPFQNVAVAQLPNIGDYVFDNPDAHRELWRGRIIDLHPRPNEDAVYQTQRDSQTGVLRSDYGLVSFRQGVAPGLHIAILGGLDTAGTRGVTHFVASPDGAAKLADAMSSFESGKFSGFQVLLRVNLQKGYEVLDTQLITLREIQNTAIGHSNP